jgi:hypothetical protein
MFRNYRKMAALGLAVALTVAVGTVTWAAGVWQTWTGIGQPSFCASTVSGVTLPSGQGPFGVVPGSTQGSGQSICGQTVPAGPPTFAGTEYLPLDIGPLGSTGSGGQSSSTVGIIQLGQGAYDDDTVMTPTSIKIANYTPFYFVDSPVTVAFTVTMPPTPVEGQIQRIVCEVTTTGTMTVAANTNQVVKNNPNTMCAAGTGYSWRFITNGAVNSGTWYRL